MTATNDITGDKLQTKVTSDQYRENYDRIFGVRAIPQPTEQSSTKEQEVKDSE